MVPDDQDVAGPGVDTSSAAPPRQRAALSAEVVAMLHEAFTEEVLDRAPRLRAVRVPVPTREVLSQGRRDAHSLAGSAAVVGQPDAARSARAVEVAIEAVLENPAAAVTESLTAELDKLLALLDAFLGADAPEASEPAAEPAIGA